MRGFGRAQSRWVRSGACLVALAVVLGGCSSTTASSSSVVVSGSTLDVWASLPPGPDDATATDVVDAERLALSQAHGRAGQFTVALKTAHRDEVSANAREAIQDKLAIAYLGEVAPGTSSVSLQITNEVGLLQVSPTDTAVYLTKSSPAVSNSPNHFYPANSTYHHTFARVVPTTLQEAKALISAIADRHLTRVYVSDDGTDYGRSVAAEIRQDASGGGLSLASSATAADAVVYAGLPGAAATHALDAAAAANPSASLFAPSALYDDTFVSSLSTAAQAHLYVTAPGFATNAETVAGRQFDAAFAAAYGQQPAPQAIFGYEAMSALLAVIQGAGTHADSRALVVARFLALKDRQSVLGTYSINGGDTSIAPFVVAHPVGGRLVPSNRS